MSSKEKRIMLCWKCRVLWPWERVFISDKAFYLSKCDRFYQSNWPVWAKHDSPNTADHWTYWAHYWQYFYPGLLPRFQNCRCTKINWTWRLCPLLFCTSYLSLFYLSPLHTTPLLWLFLSKSTLHATLWPAGQDFADIVNSNFILFKV